VKKAHRRKAGAGKSDKSSSTFKSEKVVKYEDNDLNRIERDKQLLLAKLKGDREFHQNRKRVCIKTQKEFQEQTNSDTMTLIEKMHQACIQDIEALRTKGQAMHRFTLIEYVQDQLRRKQIQDIFLEMQGCRILEMWLMKNPDNTYPPVEVVECVLSILDSLPITQQHLESCQVARAVTLYASTLQGGVNEERLPQEIVSAATKLL